MMSSIPWECMYYPNSDICAMPMAPKSEDVMFNITLDETLGDSPRVVGNNHSGFPGQRCRRIPYCKWKLPFRDRPLTYFLYGDFYYFSHRQTKDGVVVSEESGCTVTITEEVPYGEEAHQSTRNGLLGGNTIHMSSTTLCLSDLRRLPETIKSTSCTTCSTQRQASRLLATRPPS